MGKIDFIIVTTRNIVKRKFPSGGFFLYLTYSKKRFEIMLKELQFKQGFNFCNNF